jgi:NAD-specific glutamate dehydrogenase
VLQSDGRKKHPVAAWMETNQETLKPVKDMLNKMKKSAEMDYPTVSVAVRALERLVVETTP